MSPDEAAVKAEFEQAVIEVAAEDLKSKVPTLETVEEFSQEVASAIQQTKGEGQLGLSSTANELTLWNRETGEPSQVLSDQLRLRLRQRFPAGHPLQGERVYTHEKMEPLRRGHELCLLHKDHPQRAEMDEVGFRNKFCRKANLISEYEVQQHLQRKHKKAWEAKREHKQEAERREQMDLMRQQTEALLAVQQQQNAPSGVTSTPGAKKS